MPRYNDLISNLGTATIFCNNLGFGEQGAVLKNMPKSIFICPDNESCIKIQNQLNALKRNCVVLNDFNKPFTFSKFQSGEHKIDLINAIYSLIKKDTIILTIPEIFFSFIPNLTSFENSIITIDKNKDYDIIDLEKQLISIGYKKVETLTKPGEFVRRGDILDIFNLTQKNPIRLDFFDTQIEEMFFFDSLSFDKLEKANSIDIVPNKLNIFSSDEKEIILSNLNKLKLEDDLIETGKNIANSSVEMSAKQVKSSSSNLVEDGDDRSVQDMGAESAAKGTVDTFVAVSKNAMKSIMK